MLRDNLVGLIAPMRNSTGVASDDRSLCLKNPRPVGAESSLTENVTSPFQAEPAHSWFDGTKEDKGVFPLASLKRLE
jgi:hypothetical protein